MVIVSRVGRLKYDYKEEDTKEQSSSFPLLIYLLSIN
jgi:hypothetical protein